MEQKLKIEFAALIGAVDIALSNSAIIPDPAMSGTTDTVSIPLDDIDHLRAVFTTAHAAWLESNPDV